MIYYFSGTGNTRWVATSIANKLHCDAIDICSMAFDDFDHASLLSRISLDEPIGFAFPIHGWQPPHIVRRFVRSLPHSIFASRYVFGVCTCGDETGLALDSFANRCLMPMSASPLWTSTLKMLRKASLRLQSYRYPR